jgi:NAD(P)-dependent dehydrogenase (short-subunit alcohol dehydrogenase family)
MNGRREVNRRKVVVIAGISSTLGRAVADALAGQEGVRVIGGYRRWREELATTAARFDSGAATLKLSQVNVTDPESRRGFLGELSLFSDEDLVFLYCCGRWSSGRVAELTEEEIETVTSVGLIAPVAMTAQLLNLRRCVPGRTRVIIITGLGGEKSGVRYNALYSCVTSGLYSFIRAVGMELAGSSDSCCGIALGLFDKGQPYINDLCARLVIRAPTPLAEIVSFLLPHLNCEGTALNGSLVELSGGLFNYQEAAKLLTDGFAQ